MERNRRMKITILDTGPGEEEEIILKCHRIDDSLMNLMNHFKQGDTKLNVYRDGEIYRIAPGEIYYFESVDQKVFAYCRTQVYETKSKLYELERELPQHDFLRATKSSILNLNKIKSLTPAFGGRFEAVLNNGEKVIISRQYVGSLKEKLGL